MAFSSAAAQPAARVSCSCRYDVTGTLYAEHWNHICGDVKIAILDVRRQNMCSSPNQPMQTTWRLFHSEGSESAPILFLRVPGGSNGNFEIHLQPVQDILLQDHVCHLQNPLPRCHVEGIAMCPLCAMVALHGLCVNPCQRNPLPRRPQDKGTIMRLAVHFQNMMEGSVAHRLRCSSCGSG